MELKLKLNRFTSLILSCLDFSCLELFWSFLPDCVSSRLASLSLVLPVLSFLLSFPCLSFPCLSFLWCTSRPMPAFRPVAVVWLCFGFPSVWTCPPLSSAPKITILLRRMWPHFKFVLRSGDCKQQEHSAVLAGHLHSCSPAYLPLRPLLCESVQSGDSPLLSVLRLPFWLCFLLLHNLA